MHFSTLFLFCSAFSGLLASVIPESRSVSENPHQLSKRFWPEAYCTDLAKSEDPNFGKPDSSPDKHDGDYDPTIKWPAGQFGGPSKAEWVQLVKEVKHNWAMYKAGKMEDWRGRWCRAKEALCIIVQHPVVYHEGPDLKFGYINVAKLNVEGDEFRFYKYWEADVTFRAPDVDGSVQTYFAHGFSWVCVVAPLKITFMNYETDLSLFKKGLRGDIELAKTLQTGCRCHFPVTDDFIVWK
ncbi:hypothetical protein ONS96_001550 [Cadophora gregata f. sp. sojae]|nr:hypothetical protein ONS96_001550 [Cadophora gregata f. sp. sojae]